VNQSRHSGTRYSVEFKKSSAKLAIETDQAISKTASDLNIDPTTLRSWIAKYYPNHQTKTSVDMTQEKLLDENKQLRKQLARITQERDILKKATAYFAKESL
jgi:transposase-like protein